jgi:hypothetical protein
MKLKNYTKGKRDERLLVEVTGKDGTPVHYQASLIKRW